jgi:hypothetical protein
MLRVRVVEKLQVNLRNMQTCKIISFPARKFENTTVISYVMFCFVMCSQLLTKKYLRNKSLAQCKPNGGSQFWQGIMKVRQKFKWGAKFIVNNGENTLFCEDVWIGEIPLKLSFPQLYEYSREK